MKKEQLEQLIVIVNPREKATPDRLRMLNGRLKDGYTLEEITESAIAFSKSQWHKENGQMSIDNLLRPSKFGRWYANRVIGSAATYNSKKSETEDWEKERRESKQKEMMDIF